MKEPIFDLTHAGSRESPLFTKVLPFLSRVIGDSFPESVTVTINPRHELGMALKTVEKHVRRINDAAHEGLSQHYRFSVTDLSVPSAAPFKPGFLRIEATRIDAAEDNLQGSLFEE